MLLQMLPGGKGRLTEGRSTRLQRQRTPSRRSDCRKARPNTSAGSSLVSPVRPLAAPAAGAPLAWSAAGHSRWACAGAMLTWSSGIAPARRRSANRASLSRAAAQARRSTGSTLPLKKTTGSNPASRRAAASSSQLGGWRGAMFRGGGTAGRREQRPSVRARGERGQLAANSAREILRPDRGCRTAGGAARLRRARVAAVARRSARMARIMEIKWR